MKLDNIVHILPNEVIILEVKYTKSMLIKLKLMHLILRTAWTKKHSISVVKVTIIIIILVFVKLLLVLLSFICSIINLEYAIISIIRSCMISIIFLLSYSD